MTTRPSPSAHAGEHPGKIKRGNDGQRYQSVADRNGVHRWRKVTSTKPATGGARAAKTPAKAAAATKAAKAPTANKASARPSRPASKVDLTEATKELKKLIKKRKLAAHEATILAAAWPRIVASYDTTNSGMKKLGTSRIGGLPDVPAGFVWPRFTGNKPSRKGTPLHFIAQLNCADLAPLDPTGDLPRDGLLSFFQAGLFQDLGGVVLHTPAGTPLVTTACEELEATEDGILPGAKLGGFQLVLSLPESNDQSLKDRVGPELSDQSTEAGMQYDDLWIAANMRGGVAVGGFPSFVQYGVTADDDHLLLQLPGPLDFWPYSAFGDAGVLYVSIKQAALRARAWDRAMFSVQNC